MEKYIQQWIFIKFMIEHLKKWNYKNVNQEIINEYKEKLTD